MALPMHRLITTPTNPSTLWYCDFIHKQGRFLKDSPKRICDNSTEEREEGQLTQFAHFASLYAEFAPKRKYANIVQFQKTIIGN